MYAGLEDVRLLNGGIDAWKALGYSIEEHPSNRQECKGTFKLLQPKSNYLSTRNDVEKNIHDQDSIVVDVRSWNEYSGKTTGYDYMKEKGRIPNAVWGYAGSDPHHMEDYEEKNGVLKNLEEIEKLWKNQELLQRKKLFFIVVLAGEQVKHFLLLIYWGGKILVFMMADGWSGVNQN